MTPSVNSIRKIAYKVRAEFVARSVPNEFDPDLAGACGIATAILTNILKSKNVIAIPMWGDYHCPPTRGGKKIGCHAWTYLPEYDRILDITATQFGKMPKVLFKKKPNEYQFEGPVSVKWLAFGAHDLVREMSQKMGAKCD